MINIKSLFSNRQHLQISKKNNSYFSLNENLLTQIKMFHGRNKQTKYDGGIYFLTFTRNRSDKLSNATDY